MFPTHPPPSLSTLLLLSCLPSFLSSLLPPPVPSDILSLQRDLPIFSTLPPQYLDSYSGYTWNIQSTTDPSLTFNGTVPGDLITDMQLATVIDDPIYENNFLNQNLWIQNNSGWRYSVNFYLSPTLTPSNASTLLLVLDSIKLVGDIYLNSVYVGSVNDQFLRYTFPLPSSLFSPSNSPNNLTIVIAPSTDARLSEGRVEGFAAGWDWGPITLLANGKPDDTSSTRGIIRSLYLLGIPNRSFALFSMTPRVYYQGSYPLTPLTDSEAGPWIVNTSVLLYNPQSFPLTDIVVSFDPSWGTSLTNFSIPSLPSGNTTYYFPLTVPTGTVQLWWTTDTTPSSRRNQPQPLYNLTLTLSSAADPSTVIQSTRSIGFRVFVQVTADDSNPSLIANEDGSGNLTMRWKLNGANIFSRGADIIPMEWLDGRQSTRSYYRMLQSAIDANFNTLRIDGIDMYFPDYFYNLADQYGLLLYHDLQYSQAQPAPQATELQANELLYQLRRLGHHPSIAMWDACNECGGHGIYASFLMTTLAAEDTSRPVWPSSPSEGWTSGVNTLTGLPNGSPLGLQPRSGLPSVGRTLASSSSYTDYFTTVATLTPTTFTQPCTVPNGTVTNCTIQLNVDYCDTCYNSSHPSLATYEECCAACTEVNDPSVCMVAVFYDKTCWFKPGLNATIPLSSPGRVAVWPLGHGPIPPLPPPGPEPPQNRETHGPYLHGGGYPSVNAPDDTVTVTLPPSLFPSYVIGPNVSGTFASEFGCVAMSSFESMSITLDPSHWSFHGGVNPDNCTKGFFAVCTGTNPMAQRNYVMDNIVNAYFDSDRMNADEVGETAFRRHLYFSLVSQALVLSSDIQVRRSHNSWGALIWQLNEIWATGGWGSLEYGFDISVINSTDAFFDANWGYQLIGGRWKPLHYFLRKFIYTDIITVCGNDGRCYVKNDDALQRYDYSTLYATRTIVRLTDNRVLLNTTSILTNLNALGGGLISWMCLDNNGDAYRSTCNSTSTVLTNIGCQGNGSDCVLLHSVSRYDKDNQQYNLLTGHTQLLTGPNTILNYLSANYAPSVAFYTGLLNITIDPNLQPDGSIAIYINFVNSSRTMDEESTNGNIALFVTLVTRIAGRFSDNAFTLVSSTTETMDPLPVCGYADDVSRTAYCGVRYSSTYGGTALPTVYFYPWTESPVPSGGIVTNFMNTLHIQHLGMYM